MSDDVNIMLNNGCMLFDMYVCTGCFMGALCFCGESSTEMGMSQTVDNIQNDASTVYLISNFCHFLYVVCFLL